MVEFATYQREYDLIYGQGYSGVIGVDEVGRGPLCGGVYSGAVRIPLDKVHVFEGKLADSKKLSHKKREVLSTLIKENCDWGLGAMSNDDIDELNIFQATKLAMQLAVMKLNPTEKDYVLIDGTITLDLLKQRNIKQEYIIKGDSISMSIAAASIIAKVERDRAMTLIDQVYPEYGFAKHKGYGTKQHLEAIKKYGPCRIHRLTFSGVKEYI